MASQHQLPADAPRLVLINGAPGSGKSTIADLLAAEGWLRLALDIDGLKHALGQWRDDATAAGLHARRLALAVIERQLIEGIDCIVGQYLAREEFVEELADMAAACGARFHEIILDVDEPTLRVRLGDRAATPQRPEHLVNATLVTPADVPELLAGMRELAARRGTAHVVDAGGSLTETVARVRRAVYGVR